jgi:two-component system sensor histidine kinase BaeS
MLRHIYGKLFVVMLGANALLALLMYAGVSVSFEREFREHLRRQELARLEPIAAELAEGYGREGSWAWVAADPPRWAELLHRYLAQPRSGFAALPPAPASASASPSPSPSGSAAAASAPAMERGHEFAHVESPHFADTITFSPRRLLLDAQSHALIGPPDLVPRAVLRPIQWRDQVVGYLGYLPRDDLAEALDRLFAEREALSFAILTGGMLLTAILLSAGIARWISRPVQQLAEGTRALARGDYDVRTTVSGRDELAQLAADFNSLGEALQNGRRARARWIADISHELRTPLAVLRAEVDALQDGVRQPTTERLGSLAQEVAKLSRLVEDLHTLSLSDQGALEFKMAPMDLSRFVQDELESSQDLIADAGLSLGLDLAPQVPIRGDPNRLSQLIDNLRQNTLRYTDAPGRLQVTTRLQSGQAVLAWEDSAPAVPPQDLQRLTERLFRVESSRSRAGGGSGLGLSIAQAIVEAHGATMRPGASALGGLAWTISFPVLDPVAHADAHPAAHPLALPLAPSAA